MQNSFNTNKKRVIKINSNIYVNDRTIYFSDNVDDESTGIINSNLIKLIESDNQEDEQKKDFKRKPIKFYINSNGGSVEDMWATADIIQNSKTPIYTYCTGKAYSAGFWLFISGHKRFISPHALVLIHTLSSWTEGKIQTMIEQLKYHANAEKMLEKYVVEHTKINQNKLDEVREKKIDWFLTAQECLDLGVADDWIANEPKDSDNN